MSFNRENVTWQGQDGRWSLGFYRVIEGNVFDEDYDPEWDVDYDYSSFEWVRTGFRTAEAAELSYDGANPGGTTIIEFAGNEARVAELDSMAKAARR
jgi:hypothetical protein